MICFLYVIVKGVPERRPSHLKGLSSQASVTLRYIKLLLSCVDSMFVHVTQCGQCEEPLKA